MADEREDALNDEFQNLLLQADADEEGEEEPKPKKKAVADEDEPEGQPDDDEDEDRDEDEEGDAADELSSLLKNFAPKADDTNRDEAIARATAPAGAVVQKPTTDAELEALLAKIAGGTDAGSRLIQGLIKHAHATQKRIDDRDDMDEVPKRLRAMVKQVYQSGDYRTVKAAHKAVVGMLVSGELKLPKGVKKPAARADAPAKKPVVETIMTTGGGRKTPGLSPHTIREIPESAFYKALANGGRLAQILSQRYRDTGPNRLTVVRGK